MTTPPPPTAPAPGVPPRTGKTVLPAQRRHSWKSWILPTSAAAVVLMLAAGGGWYMFFRTTDPLAKAAEMLRRGDPRAAQIELRNAVRQNPGSAEAHLRLGQVQLLLSDPVAAEKELKIARDLGAYRWLTLALLSQVYLAQNRFKEVLAEVPPDGPTPDVAAKNLILRSMAQIATNDLAAGQESLRQAEKVAPNNAEVLLTAARLALATRDLANAEKKADEALAIDSKLTDALLLKAQVQTSRGDRSGSMSTIDKAIELAPTSPSPRLDRANALIVAGEDKKAQADVDYVLSLQPRNAGATYLNAVLMVRAGRYGDAASELQKLGPVIARFPRALYFQALAAANLGQTEVAVDFANRYVARVPSDPDGVRLLARAQLTAQRPERAVDVLTKAVAGGQNDAQTLDLLGRAYGLLGRTPEAIATFQKAAAAAPDDPNILTHLASTQMQQGDATSAASTLEKTVQLSPSAPNNNEALVAAALASGDVDKAEAALQQLRARVGETEPVMVLGGMVKLAKLDLEGGRAAFAAALKQYPDSLNAKLNLAKVLVLQNRRAEGEALLREILTKDPTNLATLSTYIQIMVGNNQMQPAIEAVEAARQAAPTNRLFTAMLSDLIVRSGDPRRAVGMLLALRGNEDLPPVLMGALARAQVAAGLTEDAKKTYRDILLATPTDTEARRAQVDILLREKDFSGAKQAMQEGLRVSPGNLGIMASMVQLEAQTNGLAAGVALAEQLRKDTANLPASTLVLGDFLMQAGKPADAAAAFEKEYRLQPTASLAVRLANSLVVAGKDAEGMAVLKDWQARDPEDIDVAQMIGLLDLRAKRYAEAEKQLLTVLKKKPADTVALNNLAWIYQLNNDPRARALAQRAYLQAPTPETGDTLGWIMTTTGDPKAGLAILQQVAGQRPNEPTIKYHLAYVLNAAGQKDEAIKILQPLVTGPDVFDDKDAARKLLDQLVPPTTPPRR